MEDLCASFDLLDFPLFFLEIKLGKFQSSQNTLNLVTSIEPNLKNLEQVKQLREQKILEYNN